MRKAFLLFLALVPLTLSFKSMPTKGTEILLGEEYELGERVQVETDKGPFVYKQLLKNHIHKGYALYKDSDLLRFGFGEMNPLEKSKANLRNKALAYYAPRKQTSLDLTKTTDQALPQPDYPIYEKPELMQHVTPIPVDNNRVNYEYRITAGAQWGILSPTIEYYQDLYKIWEGLDNDVYSAPTAGAMLIAYYDNFSQYTNLWPGNLPLWHRDNIVMTNNVISDMARKMRTDKDKGTSVGQEPGALQNSFRIAGYPNNVQGFLYGGEDGITYLIQNKTPFIANFKLPSGEKYSVLCTRFYIDQHGQLYYGYRDNHEYGEAVFARFDPYSYLSSVYLALI